MNNLLKFITQPHTKCVSHLQLQSQPVATSIIPGAHLRKALWDGVNEYMKGFGQSHMHVQNSSDNGGDVECRWEASGESN